MSSVSHLRRILSVFALLGGSICWIQAQGHYIPEAGEYPLVDPFPIPGDQVHASVRIDTEGGYAVWQDNATDGDGMGISARRLNQNLSRQLEIFRVNETASGDQENPKLALLADGGAVFVWQGGDMKDTDIYARFLGANGAFTTGEIRVNTHLPGLQVDPAVARLADGSVIVVWASFGQDDAVNPSSSLRGLPGVYGQRLSGDGEKLGGEFRVNQTVVYGQRNPIVAANPDGGFVVGWISEGFVGVENSTDESGSNPEGAGGGVSVYRADVVARRFSADGVPAGSEFVASKAGKRCGSPAITASEGGGFVLTWCQFVGDQVVEGQVYQSGWDVFVRSYDATFSPRTQPIRVNTFTYGDQLYPKVAGAGDQYLVVWSSRWQDGFRDGVFGRFYQGEGGFQGNEFQVNETFVGSQLYPSAASDGQGRMLATWSSFVGGVASHDLFAQRYSLTGVLEPPAPPFVSALSQARLTITWAQMDGFDVAEYHLYRNEESTPLTTGTNVVTISGLLPGSEHSFRLAYKLSDGRVSPKSSSVSGRTWGEDANFDGLPDDWQESHWGGDSKPWPSPHVDSDGDGATNLEEFLAATDPLDPDSALRARMAQSQGEVRLIWNAVPGALYQVQSSSSVGNWSNVGSLRLSVDSEDSIPVGGDAGLQLYRVIRVR